MCLEKNTTFVKFKSLHVIKSKMFENFQKKQPRTPVFLFFSYLSYFKFTFVLIYG